jgi:hypothetical protein
MHHDPGDFRDRERAAAILHFRHELRQTHKDVRMNSRVCKHSWAIINAVDERKVNLSLSSMVQRAAPNGAVSSKAPKRKKRPPQPDDDSGGENMHSSPTIPKAKKTKKTSVH